MPFAGSDVNDASLNSSLFVIAGKDVDAGASRLRRRALWRVGGDAGRADSLSEDVNFDSFDEELVSAFAARDQRRT